MRSATTQRNAYLAWFFSLRPRNQLLVVSRSTPGNHAVTVKWNKAPGFSGRFVSVFRKRSLTHAEDEPSPPWSL